jgi:IclR family KDG regulon transcriptional repressor
MSPESQSKKYIVHSLERGLEILELLAESPREWTVSEIAKALGFSPANTHKLLMSLKSTQYVAQNPENSKYKTTLKMFRVGSSLMRGFDIVTEARPLMKKLANQTNTVTCLVIQDGDEALCLEHAEGSNHVPIIFLRRGEHLPMHIGAAALLLLAFLQPDERDRIISSYPLTAWTPATVTDPEELKTMLREIREQKLCICRDGVTMGISAIAMPIYDWSGKVMATISIAGLSQNFQDEHIPELRLALGEATKELSMRIGPSF